MGVERTFECSPLVVRVFERGVEALYRHLCPRPQPTRIVSVGRQIDSVGDNAGSARSRDGLNRIPHRPRLVTCPVRSLCSWP